MENTSLRAIDAIQEAQKIAFAPLCVSSNSFIEKTWCFQFNFWKKEKKGGISIEKTFQKSFSIYWFRDPGGLNKKKR